VQISGGSISYGGTPVIAHLHLPIGAAAIVGLFGPNGCGQSTILQELCGFPEVSRASTLAIQARPDRVGYVPQDFHSAFLPWLSPLDNIALPLTFDGVARRPSRAAALKCMDEFEMRGFAFSSVPSGGQIQATVVARELAREPGLLLLDEAFSSIDYGTRLSLLCAVREFVQRNEIPVLSVSHSAEETALFSDRVFVMSAGQNRFRRAVEVGKGRARTTSDLGTEWLNEATGTIQRLFHLANFRGESA